ncbi:MAG: AlpA family transcriptional regulator [Acidobacteriaceae bacterium]
MSAPPENPTHLLRLPEVKQRVGLSRSSLYAKIQRGEFPAPIHLGERAVAWPDNEIAEWISKRVNASRGGAQ